MTIATANQTRLPALSLNAGPVYSSFEQFRKKGVDGLSTIVPGTIGTLRSKDSQYRIINDSDFQMLLGLATEVDRLRQRLTIIVSAAKVVVHHGDNVSIDHLKTTISMINGATELPTRSGWDPIELEDADFILDADDEIELDQIPRPF